jgi:8-oxo-dGTP pyrophosphatase MutT (NUDIX family)
MSIEEELRRKLVSHPAIDLPALPGRRNHLRAGVLVPLVFDPEPVAILTLRSSRLRRHAGEVCFPGGRPEADDEDLLQTALREAQEELGIEQADVLGRLCSMPVYTSDYRLVPFVAAVPDGPWVLDPREVEQLLRLPLCEVLAAPAIEAIPFTLEGREVLSPIFFPGGHTLFGATAHTFFELLCVVAEVNGQPVPPFRKSSIRWTDLRPDP